MKYLLPVLLLGLLFASSCSSGKKSLQRGNYADAIMKATVRLQSDPNNRKAAQVLREGYPMALAYYQEETDILLAGNDPFKWEKTLRIMETVNRMSETIRQTPAARQLIAAPKTYTSELMMVRERAAGERYRRGMDMLEQGNRLAAREAYNHFVQAARHVPGYENTEEMIHIAKEQATLKVVLEAIPVRSALYSLSSGFFYQQVFESLVRRFPEQRFVNFYSPDEAEEMRLDADMVINLEFFDFMIGRLQHSEREEELTKLVEERVVVRQTRDTTIYETRKVQKRGKIKVITDQVRASGVLEMKIADYQGGKLLVVDHVPGEFVWINQYGIFVGDKEVLEKKHHDILANKAYPPPAPQELFMGFSRPVFDQLTARLINYFRQFD